MIIDSLCGVPPAVDDSLAMQLRLTCPRLGVRVSCGDGADVALQLLCCEATLQGSGEVAAAVGSVTLNRDGNDDTSMLQVGVGILLSDA